MTRTDGVTYPSIGRCIYCGRTDRLPLTDEHIIPFSITGDALLFEGASCPVCQQEINKFEQPILRKMLGPFRVIVNAPTRNPKERPKHFKLKMGRANDAGQLIEPPRTIVVPAKEMHLVLLSWRLPPAGILYAEAPPRDQLRGEPWYRLNLESADRHIQNFRKATGWNGNVAYKIGDVPHFAYLRFLAKIAHGYAIAERGFDAFTHFLPDIILGKSNHYCHYVGGDAEEPEAGDTEDIFRIKHGGLIGDENTLEIVEIQLFPFYGSPIHRVVVGERESTTDEIALRQKTRDGVSV
jgi:hypothetical protein